MACQGVMSLELEQAPKNQVETSQADYVRVKPSRAEPVFVNGFHLTFKFYRINHKFTLFLSKSSLALSYFKTIPLICFLKVSQRIKIYTCVLIDMYAGVLEN